MLNPLDMEDIVEVKVEEWVEIKGERGTNLGSNCGDFKRCYSCSRLGPKSRNYCYKKET